MPTISVYLNKELYELIEDNLSKKIQNALRYCKEKGVKLE